LPRSLPVGENRRAGSGSVHPSAFIAAGGNVRAHRYRITIEGDLGWAGLQEFEGFNIESSGGSAA